jgi:diguanylate cyclase (GGDEF)-like protein
LPTFRWPPGASTVVPRWRRRTGLALLAVSATTVVAVASEYLTAGRTQFWWANGGWTASALAGVIGVATAMRRSVRTDRAGWALLLGGCVAWLVGQGCWDVYGAMSFPASPSPADVCWLSVAVAVAAGVHRLCRGSSRSLGISLLEVTPLIVAVTALIIALLASNLHASRLSGAGQVTAVAYPVLYVSAALVMLQAVLASGLDLRRNRGLAAMLAGLAVDGIGFVLWAPQLLGGTYQVGSSVLDALWSIGTLMVGLGAWASAPTLARPEDEPVARRRNSLLPALTFVVLAVVQTAINTDDGGRDLALSIGVLIVGITLIAHSMVSRSHQVALVEQVHAREQELAEANTLLRQQSRTDALTGLANRLRMREDFADLEAHHNRYGGYCLVLIDLDHFKQYNDDHGHQAGDLVLARVADLLNSTLRAGDRAYRYGGEELLLVLRDQDLPTGVAIAERYRTGLHSQSLPHVQNPPHAVVTLSAGVAAACSGETPEQVLHRADEALYEAKAMGRNRTAAATPSLAPEDRASALASV